MLQNKNMYLCNQLFFSCVKMLLLDVSGKTWQKKAYAELGKNMSIMECPTRQL